MIPFLAPLLLKMSPVGRILKSIPRQVWIAIAAVAILLVGSCVHKRAVIKYGKEQYAAGVKAEGDRIADEAKRMKARIDAQSAQISQLLKDKNDAQNRAIARSADDLRLRGPGKAICPGHSSLPASPGESIAPSWSGNAATGQVPGGEWGAVPWGWFLDSAERCDLNRAEVLAWREWYAKQSEAWAKIR